MRHARSLSQVKTLSEVLARSCYFLATPSLETQATALACMRDCVVKLASAGADAGEGRQLDPDRPFSCRSSCRHHVDEYYLVSSVKHSSMVHMMLRPPQTARLRVCYNIVLFFLIVIHTYAWPRLASPRCACMGGCTGGRVVARAPRASRRARTASWCLLPSTQQAQQAVNSHLFGYGKAVL